MHCEHVYGLEVLFLPTLQHERRQNVVANRMPKADRLTSIDFQRRRFIIVTSARKIRMHLRFSLLGKNIPEI